MNFVRFQSSILNVELKHLFVIHVMHLTFYLELVMSVSTGNCQRRLQHAQQIKPMIIYLGFRINIFYPHFVTVKLVYYCSHHIYCKFIRSPGLSGFLHFPLYLPPEVYGIWLFLLFHFLFVGT